MSFSTSCSTAKPRADAGAAVFGAIETGLAEGPLAAHAVTTIHYLIRKEMRAPRAKRILSALLRVLGVAAVDGHVIQQATGIALPGL